MIVTMRRIVTAATLSLMVLGGLAAPRANADFEIRLFNAGGLNAVEANAFAQAASLWEDKFADDMFVNIYVGFLNLPAGVIGETDTADFSIKYDYTVVRDALIADKTSPDDILATSHLQTTDALSLITNNQNGGKQVFQSTDNDAINSSIVLTGANAKALGLLQKSDPDYDQPDALIVFSNSFINDFDFDPSNGIDPGKQDFVGAAAHEIGHALGFISGVDDIDYASSPNFDQKKDLTQQSVFTPLDLFRYSNASDTVLNGVRVPDLRQGANSYFSLDGGVTNIANFSTGQLDGDGNQASHWKDNHNLGIMDPTEGDGETLVIRQNDLRAFDVIGYDLKSNITIPVAAPEPGTLSLLGLGLLGGVVARRRKR